MPSYPVIVKIQPKSAYVNYLRDGAVFLKQSVRF